MDYGLDSEQEDFRQAVRQFATKALAPHYQRDDKTATFRREQALDLAAMGLTGLRNATPEQQAAWLPGIAAGTTVPCICITEPGHGTDAASLELKAIRTATGWTLHGEKTSITLGMASDRAVVLARTG